MGDKMMTLKPIAKIFGLSALGLALLMGEVKNRMRMFLTKIVQVALQ